jgi:hypothetical protein
LFLRESLFSGIFVLGNLNWVRVRMRIFLVGGPSVIFGFGEIFGRKMPAGTPALLEIAW